MYSSSSRWGILTVAIVLLLSAGEAAGKRYVMPWMCLERCNFTSAQIAQQLDTISLYHELISGVSFEMFNLGPDSSLILNNLSSVHAYLTSAGMETYAMLSSYPYPPQFLDWMRELFLNPEPFITACVSAASQYNLTGFEVDFEPVSPNATQEDAQNYAQFLSKFASALHSAGKKLHVDIADWSVIWDFSLLGQSGVDRVVTMTTYTNNTVTWEKKFQNAIAEIPLNTLGIGLQTMPMNTTDMQYRITQLVQNNVQFMGIWDMPLPGWWWPYLATKAKYQRAFGDALLPSRASTTALEMLQSEEYWSSRETVSATPASAINCKRPLPRGLCSFCNSPLSLSSERRRGPKGKNTLCNPCGLKWARDEKRVKRTMAVEALLN